MKKWGGGQLDIRPPQSENWGGRVPPIPPRIDAPGWKGQEKKYFQNYCRISSLLSNRHLEVK